MNIRHFFLQINLKVNNFVKLKLVAQYEKVRYYSVLIEGNKYTEFEKFIIHHRHDPKIKEEFNDLLQWIKDSIGTRFGALSKYFRHEGAADGLPPQAKYLQIDYEENLRLYCYRITDHIVILFNGGIKTKGIEKSQDCEIVKQHFTLANKLTNAINEEFKSKELVISEDQRELIFEKTFEIVI